VRIMTSRKRIFILSGLCVIGLFGLVGLRAGEALSMDANLLAAPSVPNPPLNVAEANRDAGGNIKVHEQGTVSVTGTVDVGNAPKVQDVNVTNGPLVVRAADRGVQMIYSETIDDFDAEVLRTIDIHEYARVRFQSNVNGSGTVEYFVSTDGGVKEHFSLDATENHTLFLGEAAGTKLHLQLVDPDGEQVFLRVFGSN
jgi:hypothetical protein